MRKKKLFFSALSIALIGAIGISGILLTNSKYATTVEGNAKASIAKWVFDVSASDSYSESDTIESINLAETCTPETLVDGNIAPGTEGSFDIVIDTTGNEVGIDYAINFTNLPTNFPKNLVFSVDNQEYDLATGFTGNIAANAKGKQVTKTVNWKWLYEAENESDIASEDVEDTEDGITAAKDLTFDITVTGTQVRPVQQ